MTMRRISFDKFLSEPNADFATNRFEGDMRTLQRFRDVLERHGAKQLAVVVDTGPGSPHSRGEPYSSTLFMNVNNLRAPGWVAIVKSHPDEIEVDGSGTLRLWWD